VLVVLVRIVILLLIEEVHHQRVVQVLYQLVLITWQVRVIVQRDIYKVNNKIYKYQINIQYKNKIVTI
jgi:hypothetical protein